MNKQQQEKATNILFVAAENDALPQGKVGGIGDVIRDVPQFLANSEITVDVITPSYSMHAQHPKAVHQLAFDVDFYGRLETINLFKIALENQAYCQGEVNQWVLEHPLFSNAGEGAIYCDDGPDKPFASDATKFALFSIAVCQLVTDYWHDRTDILHLHDWHAAWVAILREYVDAFAPVKSKRCVYTIHNLALQGIRPLDGDASSLKAWYPQYDLAHADIIDPRYPNCVNPTRAAINLCDAIHAVSPTYAKEITLPSAPEFGYVGGEGLEKDLLSAQQDDRLFGILNGCVYQHDITTGQFDDIAMTAVSVWQQKAPDAEVHKLAKTRLASWQHQECIGPIVTSIGRVTSQKIAILLTHVDGKPALCHLLDRLALAEGRLMILGSGDAELSQALTAITQDYPCCIFLNGYNAELSESLFDIGDLFLMPSSFEPCGISQLLAMRAGQPCLVNQIGGLNDTVFDGKTGFCFSGNTPIELAHGLIACFERALDCFAKHPAKWQSILSEAQATRFEWPDAIEHYKKELYQCL